METIDTIKQFWAATKGNWFIRVVAIIWATTIGTIIIAVTAAVGMILSIMIFGYGMPQHAKPLPATTEAYHGPRHEGRAPMSQDEAFLFGPTHSPAKPKP